MSEVLNNFWRDDIRPDREVFRVVMSRGALVDKRRADRLIPLKCYYPVLEKNQPLPLVLWSHGLGGSVDGAAFLSRYLAGHGYIILHVQHAGSDSALWEGTKEHPWDVIRRLEIPRSASLHRFADISFVLDHLADFWTQISLPASCVDLERIGLSGHSFGALTTQVLLGQRFPDEEGVLRSYTDRRFRAGILYSPVSSSDLYSSLPAEAYGTIDRPILHMTGTEDSSPVEGYPYEDRLRVYDSSIHAERYLMILRDGDHMIYNGSRGKLGQNPNRAQHEEFVKVLALAFWDMSLKGSSDAKTWFIGGSVDRYLGQAGWFRFALPSVEPE